MKIMLVCDSMGIGGAETHVLGLAEGLCREGHFVTVAAKSGELVNALLESCGGGARFIELSPRSNSVIGMAAYVVALGKMIKRIAPDVIHAHSRKTAFAIRTLMAVGYVKKVPFVVTAHAKYCVDCFRKRLSAWGDVCIAVSEDIRDHLCAHFGASADSIEIIPNGIDTDEFLPSATYTPHSILFASRLDADTSHGAYCLCKIADRLSERFPKIKIFIAGGGSELQRLMDITPKVEFLGALPSLSDVISTSELVIGVSRVALEAMSCEKNVLLFGNEGALGLLDEDNLAMAEKTNFTCRDGGIKDEEFLFAEIERFFDSDKIKRKKTARHNRKYVVENHSLSDTAKRTFAVYNKLIVDTPRILIGGYYGFSNLGDDAMLDALISFLKWRLSSIKNVCVLRGRNGNVSGVGSVDRYSPLKVVSEMMRADIFILGGGSLLQNETSTRSLLYYCTLVFLSKLCQCKRIILSNGIGPLKSRFAEKLSIAALRMADRVSVRDGDSLAFLRSIGFEKATLGADLCFLLEPTREESERVERAKLACKDGYALVAMKGGAVRDRAQFVNELKSTMKDRGLMPIFVAMDGEADTEGAIKFAKRCGGVYLSGLSRGEITSLLFDCEVAVGERLHFLIFSLLAKKGFVGIGNSPKIKSFCREALGMKTVDVCHPSSLGELVDRARSQPIEKLELALDRYKKRLVGELLEIQKAFFV